VADIFEIEKNIIPQALYGIIGYPLGHSLSPILHNWALKKKNIPAAYYKWELAGESLPSFMQALRQLPIHGLSITIPHKQAVIPYLDVLTPRAQSVGAVNTLSWIDGKLTGENTDIEGFLAPLRQRHIRPQSALILGAGGAARAVAAGLLEMGVGPIWITSRRESSAQAMIQNFKLSWVPWEKRGDVQAEMLVNTTPLGMQGELQNESPWPKSEYPKASKALYDLVYNPKTTVWLTHGKEAGLETIAGLEMFLHQALCQFKLWTGSTFSISEAATLLQAKLESA
jgi:shikimate dehydrogenase